MKRLNTLLLMILAAAFVLFGCYHIWVHNRLDTVGPELIVDEGLLEISVKDEADVLLTGIRALDERDGDVTSSILVESVYGIDQNNMTTVTYVAFDRAGNVSKTQRQVRYVDYEHPRFQLYGSLTFSYGSGFDLLEYLGAQDVIEGDIRRRVHATLISDTKSIEAEGRHQVKLQVTNSLGDTSELVVPVEVFDPEWYAADVRLSDYLIYLDRGSRFDARSYLEKFIFRGEPIDMTRGTPEGVSVEIDNGVNMNEPGVYEVSYILSKSLNMNMYSGIAKLIVVVE
ncbi:MAG: hypothetical protein IJX04_02410 [Oscillospiraceae bacterium]|nr:hypothetical protein [Oscillospiraceae bacterium]MBQ8354730.1 hypothetical protein [Oscillospiraceae bacterium]